MTAPFQAMIRFGFGRRGDEKLPDDPPRWLLDQLGGPDPANFPPGLPTTADGLLVQRESQRLKFLPGESIVAPVLHMEVKAQMNEALTTAAPFRERLVWFWANHFTVSLHAGEATPIIGAYVREAIRPNVTGSFAAMLLAVMRHPAMLIYLDNISSIGPNSLEGKHARKGLNENLARECLELHTLSPASGYTQGDVTAFARVLTGWTVALDGPAPGFVFRPERHEPGEKTVMGRRFPEGEIGGLMALEFLAGHEATHRHLARKLVQHFVADDPPPAAMASVAAALRDTNGDLGAAAAAIVALPGAWAPLTKLRSPTDFVLACLRSLTLTEDGPQGAEGPMAALGQPLWNAPAPIGWPDRALDWASGEAITQRVDFSYGLAARAPDAEPADIAQRSLGPLLRAETLAAIRNAGSRREGLTFLLASPEFQRR